MTVKELKEKLNKVPDHLKIVLVVAEDFIIPDLKQGDLVNILYDPDDPEVAGEICFTSVPDSPRADKTSKAEKQWQSWKV